MQALRVVHGPLPGYPSLSALTPHLLFSTGLTPLHPHCLLLFLESDSQGSGSEPLNLTISCLDTPPRLSPLPHLLNLSLKCPPFQGGPPCPGPGKLHPFPTHIFPSLLYLVHSTFYHQTHCPVLLFFLVCILPPATKM